MTARGFALQLITTATTTTRGIDGHVWYLPVDARRLFGIEC